MGLGRDRDFFRRTAWAVTFLCLAALACNFPLSARNAGNDPAQQTLEARPGQMTTPAGTVLPFVTVLPPAQTVDETPTPETGGGWTYQTQPGDTAAALAKRFDVDVETITAQINFSPTALLPAGVSLRLADNLGQPRFRGRLLPDSEIVYSPTTQGFSVVEFVNRAGGFLSTYQEEVNGEMLSGAQIIERVASETSTNPRVLLGVLEFRSGWVFGQPADGQQTDHPIGFNAEGFSGLEREITLVARYLTTGYYGWRSGEVTSLEFPGAGKYRLDPTLNAGSAAVQSLFSKLAGPDSMGEMLYGPDGFAARYAAWMGDPWQRDAKMGPLFQADLTPPVLELPFPVGQTWAFTGGPHPAWGVGSVWGGVDFSPADESGCKPSPRWAVASVPGLVVRSERGIVVVDLDGDGQEQTGWGVMYLHLAEEGRAAVGTLVKTGDPLGHPSCEGGVSTGKNVHLARKYNGEWIGAEGPLPLTLSGWQVVAAGQPYHGALVKEDQVVTSLLDGTATSRITH
jgi:hypothetical protein